MCEKSPFFFVFQITSEMLQRWDTGDVSRINKLKSKLSIGDVYVLEKRYPNLKLEETERTEILDKVQLIKRKLSCDLKTTKDKKIKKTDHAIDNEEKKKLRVYSLNFKWLLRRREDKEFYEVPADLGGIERKVQDVKETDLVDDLLKRVKMIFFPNYESKMGKSYDFYQDLVDETQTKISGDITVKQFLEVKSYNKIPTLYLSSYEAFSDGEEDDEKGMT